ncbi:hypothetical protein JHN59_16060 [Streptomyces sp. MBT49]|uniref:DUF6879 family protein n=1 Tax=Streptomyces sp. MBT49 TaxID=1488380 RepID=UPI00190DCBFD|nr:DUF6879 family protein [Streptomyces sp. MBT49]MBK3626332.1 hypothetical protein [Streptomyces sp. MBT49]
MELISSAERNRLFERFHHDAFHLELRDDYSVPDEDGPFKRWLAGTGAGHSHLAPWLYLVGQSTARGMTVRRVRVVTEPLTPYIQWEYTVTAANQGAGEDVRWLPRRLLPVDVVFPFGGQDWWLFDERLLAVGHFDQAGRNLGSQIIEDAPTVTQCARLRDRLWTLAVPHTEYTP